MQQRVWWFVRCPVVQSWKTLFPLIVCWPLWSRALAFPVRNVSDLDSPVTQKCAVSGDTPWSCCTARGGQAGPQIPFHTPVNAVWFYCHFLWWKVINPFLPLLSPSPPNYLSSSQHPWPLEREHHGADRPSFIPREMGCFWAASGPPPLIRPFHKPHCCLLGLYI